jgi:hypothetical protein
LSHLLDQRKISRRGISRLRLRCSRRLNRGLVAVDIRVFRDCGVSDGRFDRWELSWPRGVDRLHLDASSHRDGSSHFLENPEQSKVNCEGSGGLSPIGVSIRNAEATSRCGWPKFSLNRCEYDVSV